MRNVEFPVNTRQSTRERVNAILWIFSRLGTRNIYSKSGNATKILVDELEKLGSPRDYTTVNITTALKFLIDHDYVESMTEGRKRYAIVVKDDVNLDVPPPHFYKKFQTNNTKVNSIPIPGKPAGVELYRLKELRTLLESWHEQNPEAYSVWVDNAIDSLENVT